MVVEMLLQTEHELTSELVQATQAGWHASQVWLVALAQKPTGQVRRQEFKCRYRLEPKPINPQEVQ